MQRTGENIQQTKTELEMKQGQRYLGVLVDSASMEYQTSKDKMEDWGQMATEICRTKAEHNSPGVRRGLDFRYRYSLRYSWPDLDHQNKITATQIESGSTRIWLVKLATDEQDHGGGEVRHLAVTGVGEWRRKTS